MLCTESGNAVVQLRVRQSLSAPSAPWHLLYCGQLDSGEHRPTALRTSVSVPCSHSLLLFLDEMGFMYVAGRARGGGCMMGLGVGGCVCVRGLEWL